MLGNLHTHTHFSDGSAPPGEYVKEAITLGFSVLGFSDHSPVPFPNTFAIPEGGVQGYVEGILSLPVSTGFYHPGTDLEILLGLEFDYIPGLTGSVNEIRKTHPFDFVIGSVHLIRNDNPGMIWFIDGPRMQTYDKGLRDVFHGDVRKAVTAYWKQIQEMVAVEHPDIVGHLDKIKMHNRNRYFSEEDGWYGSLVDETLEMIKAAGTVVEVNTRGLYKKRSDSLFPGPWILKKIDALEIPVTITSDAHRPEELGLFLPETRALLLELGFRSHWLLTKSGWKEVTME